MQPRPAAGRALRGCLPGSPAQGALGWHIRARCGAHVPAHCASARVPGLLPSHSAGTIGPHAVPRPALPQIIAAARLKGCARASTRALHKMWLIVQPGRSRVGQKQHIVVQCRYAAIATPAGVRAPLPARGGCSASCPRRLPAAAAHGKREDAGALPPPPPRSPLRQEGPILSAPPGLERMAPCRCVKGTLCPCEHILTRLAPGCGIPPTALDTPTRDRSDLKTANPPSRAETHPPRKAQTERGR